MAWKTASTWLVGGFLCLSVCMAAACGQSSARPPASQTGVPAAPVTPGSDSGMAGELPLDTSGAGPAADVSAASSPVAGQSRGLSLKAGTELRVALSRTVTSGDMQNDQSVAGTLTAPVTVSGGRVLPAGTAVRATIVSAAAAGKISSAGLLSLEVDQVGGVPVNTDVLEFSGQDGRRDLADSAPAKGTEATVAQGTMLTFHVMGAGDQPDLSPGGGAGGVGGRGVSGGRGAAQSAAPASADTVGPPIHGATTAAGPH